MTDPKRSECYSCPYECYRRCKICCYNDQHPFKFEERKVSTSNAVAVEKVVGEIHKDQCTTCFNRKDCNAMNKATTKDIPGIFFYTKIFGCKHWKGQGGKS